MDRILEEIYQNRRYIQTGGHIMKAYHIIFDTDLGLYLNKQLKQKTLFGKLGDLFSKSTKHPILFDKIDAESIAQKI